jgi:2-alkenal reductase
VNITSVALVSPTPGAGAQEQRGIGSGFILDRDGRIVTNNHVVQDATQLNVTFSNRATFPAQLVGRDPDNDLAVVRVDPNATYEGARSVQELLRPAALGDSDQVVIGEYAVAIGSPLGLQQTVTSGIVSAIREPGEDVGVGSGAGSLDLLGGAIQTDASINPGNSGGPLFNAAGEVIGVNTAILSRSGGNIGIGFAIPINVVKRVAPVLIQSGRYPHPFIGVTTIALSRLGASLKRDLGLPENQTGLLVQEVTAGAQQAGLRAGQRSVNVEGGQIRLGGDIIVAIDGQRVTGGELRAYIENNKRPGDTATLTVLRDGQRVDIPVALSERPQTPTQTPPQPRGSLPSP